MRAYYNDNDRHACAWTRELIRSNLIAIGDVDERSIVDVRGDDLKGYTRCSFFNGIAGWDLALQMAGWPADEEVWTGSCPCQPFSVAGKRKGEKDERHLWPEFRRLIAERLPATVLGEQTSSKAGREWLTRVRSDLEELGYEVGAADLCVAGSPEKAEGWFVRRGEIVRRRVSIGAPHLRHRLYWGVSRVGDADGGGRKLDAQRGWGQIGLVSRGAKFRPNADGSSLSGGLGDADDRGEGEVGSVQERQRAERERSLLGGVGDADGSRQQTSGIVPGASGTRPERSVQSSPPRGMGDADCEGRQGHRAERGLRQSGGEIQIGRTGGSGFWSRFDALPCRDGKARRVEPGTYPLAHGVSGRVALLRGYGNSICPQTTSYFIKAFREAKEERANEQGQP